MEFAAEWQASLEKFTASGVVKVRENGGSVAPFSGMSYGSVRRRLTLAVERLGHAKPGPARVHPQGI